MSSPPWWTGLAPAAARASSCCWRPEPARLLGGGGAGREPGLDITPAARSYGANIAAVAQLTKYGDVQRSAALQAVAYELLPEQKAYDLQVGSGAAGLYSGVGRIGIPA